MYASTLACMGYCMLPISWPHLGQVKSTMKCSSLNSDEANSFPRPRQLQRGQVMGFSLSVKKSSIGTKGRLPYASNGIHHPKYI